MKTSAEKNYRVRIGRSHQASLLGSKRANEMFQAPSITGPVFLPFLTFGSLLIEQYNSHCSLVFFRRLSAKYIKYRNMVSSLPGYISHW